MKRIISLDAMRGLTVACMILVNNGHGSTFSILEHSKWNGMTPCDLVFPFFLFMVGVSIFISFHCRLERNDDYKKIIKRTFLLFFIGLVLHAWNMFIRGDGASFPERLRFSGVLQRIALCYGAASWFLLYFKGKYLWRAAILLLIFYMVILVAGNGYNESDAENILAIVDRKVLGYHILLKAYFGTTTVDPEGLISTIPSIAHTMIGISCGKLFVQRSDLLEKNYYLLHYASLMGLSGYLLSFQFPINKSIWSPTFVLISCSIAASTLTLFSYIYDNNKCNFGLSFLKIFGTNALFLYIISQMIPIVLVRLGWSEALYSFWASVFIRFPEVASLCFALTHVLLIALIGWGLYKKSISIKI